MKPRKASQRWLDGDCPNGVLAIFDHPNYGDRYTVFYRDTYYAEGTGKYWIGYRAMSENPCHPQGIGIYSEMSVYDCAAYRRVNSRYACKWSDLPQAVRDCVKRDLMTDDGVYA